MLSKKMELSEKINNESFTNKQLVEELSKARSDTFKYVNKLLEVEEKWSFINLLLKKLNSLRDVESLCKTICDGFLVLTNSKLAACFLFNLDTGEIENKKLSYAKMFEDKAYFLKLIQKVNVKSEFFIKKSVETDKINRFFESVCAKNTIIVPIYYTKDFLGYFLLVKDEETFYRDNIHFINIFPEHFSLIIANIFLYQESEKRNKQKIEFLAGISHEYKTPLNSIIGFTDILKNEKYNTKQMKYLENISGSSKHLLSLIQDVLDVSKSQFGELTLNFKIFNTKQEIMKIIAAFENMVEEKHIDLTFTLCDVNINADVNRFRQLIFNLISNAVKFNKINGKIVILSYVSKDKFSFEILDTGDGISKQDYDKIFDFFSQVNRNQLKRQQGSGVGLALCKMIVDSHKGQIGFNSQFKKGSSFWFNLPLIK